MIEKKQMTDRMAKLEADLKAQESINLYLTKRVKMLEFSLRQERIKYANLTGGHHRVHSDVIQTILARVETGEASSGVQKKRQRAHRQLLSKYLHELSLDDIFTSELPNKLQPHHRPSKSFGSAAFAQTLEHSPEVVIQRPQQSVMASQEIMSPQFGSKRQDSDSQETMNTEETVLTQESPSLQTRKVSLHSHMDAVRCVKFTSREGVLVSSGEDCIIKLWDINGYQAIEDGNLEPYISLRGHSAGVTALAQTSGNSMMLYSSDLSGEVLIWVLPMPRDVIAYGSSDEQEYLLGKLTAHTEPIWSLEHHLVDNHMLSSSSDGSVKIWRTLDVEMTLDNARSGRIGSALVKSFTNENYTPTVCSWINTDVNTFAVGYTRPYLALYDRNSTKPTLIKFIKDNDVLTEFQINSMVSLSGSSLLAAGHEDKTLRVFDINSCSCIQQIGGFSSSLSSVSCDKTGNTLATGTHDGKIRIWDTRTYTCLDELSIHQPKFEEGTLSIDYASSLPLFATGGADSLVNLFTN